jgi:hypothetical protein
MSFRRRRICVVEEGDETALRQNMLALPWERCKFCGMPLLKKGARFCPENPYARFLACLRRRGVTTAKHCKHRRYRIDRSRAFEVASALENSITVTG